MMANYKLYPNLESEKVLAIIGIKVHEINKIINVKVNFRNFEILFSKYAIYRKAAIIKGVNKKKGKSKLGAL